MSVAARLRNEAQDLLELVLLPGLAALLPWRLCFRFFKFLCRFDFLYREECNEAAQQAHLLGWIHGDRAIWLQTRRLITLVDHADFYLSLTRSDRWIARNVNVSGEWPDPTRPAILCTFHWGAGMWGLRHAGSRAMRAHALVAPQVRESFPGRTVKFLYCRQRVRTVGAALRTGSIEVTGSMRGIIRVLRRAEQIVAAVDVPADQVAASESIDLLGLRARVPRGLMRIAAELRVPVVVYLTGIRLSDGQRMLCLHYIGERSDPAVLTAEVFAFLDNAIRREAAAWHFWSVAPRFFDESAAGPGERTHRPTPLASPAEAGSPR